MTNTEDDSTSDIEAAVLKRLSNWADPPEYPAPRPESRRVKKRRSKTRPKTTSDALPEPQHDEIEKVQNALAASVKEVSKRVISRAIIAPRSEQPTKPSPRSRPLPHNSTSAPLVVKARDMAPRSRRRDEGDAQFVARKTNRNPERANRDKDVDAAEFVDTHRHEVGRFGSQALHKRDRKSFEAAELLRLGCRPTKKQKIPIGLLISKREKQKVREANKKELDLASGMLVRSKRR